MNAADIMTTRLVTAAPDTPVMDLVRLMVDRHVSAVPIVEDGKLLGVVSHDDVICALASRNGDTAPLSAADRRVRDAMAAALSLRPWSDIASNPTIIVNAGVLHLWGPVDSETDRQALLELAASMPGARGVEDHMTASSHHEFGGPHWPLPHHT